MKRKMFAVLAAICLVLVALFAVGCGKDDLRSQVDRLQQQLEQLTEEKDKLAEENEQLAGEKGDLSGDLAQLQEMFSALEEENAMTLEQLAALQLKLKKISEIDWMSEKKSYWIKSVCVYILRENADVQFRPEDFLPVEIREVDLDMSGHKFVQYRLRLANPGLKEVADALIQLNSMEFIAWADLSYGISGA